MKNGLATELRDLGRLIRGYAEELESDREIYNKLIEAEVLVRECQSKIY